jgi:DNA-binding transcriptional MerR regulator
MAGFLIGVLAREAGVSAPTVRYYEEVGLLPPSSRTSGGYRRYTDAAVHELRFIRKAQGLGFSLDEIRVILKLSRAGEAQCAEVLTLARRHLKAVDDRIAHLQQFRAHLAGELAKWDGQQSPTCGGLCQMNRWNVVANLGASLPRGRSERPRFCTELLEGSLVPMSRLQRGSGTLDPLFGVNVDRRFGTYTFFSSIAARVPINENEFGLRTGLSSEVTTGASHTLGHHRIAGYGRLGWLRREQDVFDAIPVLVGGGDWLYLTPGVSVQAGRGFSVQAEVKLPAYRSLANHQLDSRAIWQFGVSRVF